MGKAGSTHFEDLGELSSGDISIDVEDLALGVLGQRGQDGETPGLDSGLDRCLVNSSDLSDETVLGLVQVISRKDTGRDGSGTCTETLKSGGELQVLLQEDSLDVSKLPRLKIGQLTRAT